MKTLAIPAILILLAASASAGSPEANYHGHGYLQFGVGGCSNLPCGTVRTLTGGGEAFVYRGLAAGAEAGYGWAANVFSAGAAMLSVNPAYHFKGQGRARRVVPFITGGYTGLFRQVSINGSNFGGGVTVWPGDHVGLRFEGRLYHFNIAGISSVNFVVARFGIAAR